MYSAAGQPIYISPMFEKVWGMRCEQWYNDPTIGLKAVHPEDYERVSTGFQDMLKNNSDYDLECRIIRPDGSLRIIYDRGFPIIDETGKIYRVAGISEDITERQQEQQKIIKAMARLSEIGELATTIVHEVRNPLTTVLMGLNFFNRMELPEQAKKRLVLALDEAERLRRLLNEILLYAKHDVIQAEPIELNDLALNLIDNIADMPGAIGKQILFRPWPARLVVAADMDKLKQVLINLLQNACEAVEQGESIMLQISPQANSRQVRMQIHNGGAPIPPELLPKLTEPFFTTKSTGNGLGLAIVKKIVEAHQGTLTIESTAIAGTIVNVSLPMHE